MIKLIITATLLLIAALGFSQDNGKATQGEFNGRLCDIGRGLCTISPPDTNNKSTTMKNYTSYKKSYNSIMFELDTNILSKEDQKMFFGKEYTKINANERLSFVQDADFEFDYSTLKYLDISYQYRILKKGEYPLEIVDGKVQITITLSEEE